MYLEDSMNDKLGSIQHAPPYAISAKTVHPCKGYLVLSVPETFPSSVQPAKRSLHRGHSSLQHLETSSLCWPGLAFCLGFGLAVADS